MSAPSRLTRQRETLVERRRRASACSPGRACPARRTTKDGRSSAKSAVVTANGSFASMSMPVLSSISMRRSEAKKRGEDQRLGAVLVHHRVPGGEHRLGLARALVGGRDPGDERLQRLRRQRQVVGLHRSRSRQGCACRSCRRTAGCAGRGNLRPSPGRRSADGRRRTLALLALKAKPAFGLWSCGSASNGTVPTQSNAPEAPSTGARPSPDLRSGITPGLRKPMSPVTSAKTTFWVGATTSRSAARNSSQYFAASRRMTASSGRVAVGEAGEGQRDRLARPGDAGEIVADVGQHGAVAGRPDRQLHVGAVLDADRLLVRLERLRAVGREVLRGIGRVDRLDEQVLRVGVGGGDAPGDMVVLAEQHDRRAGHGRALDPAVGRDDPGEVPQDRRAEAEVRVVGEDRLAGDGARTRDHPFVRRAAAQARSARRSCRRRRRAPAWESRTRRLAW